MKINMVDYSSLPVRTLTKSKSTGEYEASSGQSIRDLLTLSPEAQNMLGQGSLKMSLQVGGQTLTDQHEISNYHHEMMKTHERQQVYHEAQHAFHKAQRRTYGTTWEKLNRESGGLLSGAAISNDLSTITTTSGSSHPMGNQIRSFLREHANEWNSLHSPKSFPSFDEWQTNQG